MHLSYLVEIMTCDTRKYIYIYNNSDSVQDGAGGDRENLITASNPSQSLCREFIPISTQDPNQIG